jgi:DNA damage-inducible protein 1
VTTNAFLVIKTTPQTINSPAHQQAILIMRITFNIAADEEDIPEQDLLSVDVAPDTTVGILKESVQAELQLPKSSQHLYHNGLLLSDEAKTMEQLQISDGDMLALHIRHTVGRSGLSADPRAQQPSRRQAAVQRPRSEPDPELIRLQLLGDPRTRQEALRGRPELAAAIDSPERFAQLYRQMMDQERQEQLERSRRIAELNADPFDIDAQTRIAEMIREEAVQENLQNAIEHNPEGRYPFVLYCPFQTDTLVQSLAGSICSTLMSKSTVTKSRHLLILELKQPSCPHHAQKLVVS